MMAVDAVDHLDRHARKPAASLAANAAAKLRQLVGGGGLDLSLVLCSCPAGTEGTQAGNYGRACGVLKTAGKDVGGLLIHS